MIAGTDTQRLWLCRWGSQTALVWAQTAANAELRVRRRCFERTATLNAVESRPELVRGEVAVREATELDLRNWRDAGGPDIR